MEGSSGVMGWFSRVVEWWGGWMVGGMVGWWGGVARWLGGAMVEYWAETRVKI